MHCPNHATCENQNFCTSLCPVVDNFGSTLLVDSGGCSACPRKIHFADYAICTCPQRLTLYLATRA